MNKKRISEATGSGSSGHFKVPLVLAPQDWKKDTLAPFTTPVSKYLNADLAYDDDVKQPLNVSKKLAAKIERETKIAAKKGMNDKKNPSGQNDDDGGNLNEHFKVNKNEYAKIIDNDKYVLVVPLTHEASCKYGANTKWCTTKKSDDEDFVKHSEFGLLAYLIIKDPLIVKKIGSPKFAIFRENFEKKGEGMVYDEMNKEYNLPWLEYMFEKIGKLSDYNYIMEKYNQYFYENGINKRDSMLEQLIRKTLRNFVKNTL